MFMSALLYLASVWFRTCTNISCQSFASMRSRNTVTLLFKVMYHRVSLYKKEQGNQDIVGEPLHQAEALQKELPKSLVEQDDNV